MMKAADSKGVCRCEARIASVILEGYACGNPDCWRTGEAKASFEAFVAVLVAERGDVPGPEPRQPEPHQR